MHEGATHSLRRGKGHAQHGFARAENEGWPRRQRACTAGITVLAELRAGGHAGCTAKQARRFVGTCTSAGRRPGGKAEGRGGGCGCGGYARRQACRHANTSGAITRTATNIALTRRIRAQRLKARVGLLERAARHAAAAGSATAGKGSLLLAAIPGAAQQR